MNSLMPKVQNPESIAIWTKRITDCKNSGMPTQEWCTANGIHIKTYYYWHNKIHKIVQNQSAYSKWSTTFANTVMVATIVSRSSFQSYILDMTGRSYRLELAKSISKEWFTF